MGDGKRLVGKVAIVTGGASGIGAETARVFAENGASVVLCDVNAELGQSVASEIEKNGGEAVFRELNVTDELQWSALIAETEERFGRLDILTNSAGISGRTSAKPTHGTVANGALLENQSLEQWNRVLAVNATGTFLGTRQAIAPMIRAGGGSIVNISSICGIVGSFGNTAYHASKGAVRIFSKATAVQYAPAGIRVNSIHPGFVDTPMSRPVHADPEVSRMRLAATPLGRFGVPRDIALGCLYLASDDSAWVTGTELIIDGGMTAN